MCGAALAEGMGQLSLRGAGDGQLRGRDGQRRGALRYVGFDTRPPHVETKQGVAFVASCHLHVARKKRKVLPEPQGSADLRFISPQPDTSLHCQTTDTGLVHHVMCLLTSRLSLVLIAPTHGGMARLS